MSFFSATSNDDFDDVPYTPNTDNDVDYSYFSHDVYDGEEEGDAHAYSSQSSVFEELPGTESENLNEVEGYENYTQYSEYEQPIFATVTDSDAQSGRLAANEESQPIHSGDDYITTSSTAPTLSHDLMNTNTSGCDPNADGISSSPVVAKAMRSDGYISSDSSSSSVGISPSLPPEPETTATARTSSLTPSFRHATTFADSAARRPPADGEPVAKKTTSSNPLQPISRALYPASPSSPPFQAAKSASIAAPKSIASAFGKAPSFFSSQSPSPASAVQSSAKARTAPTTAPISTSAAPKKPTGGGTTKSTGISFFSSPESSASGASNQQKKSVETFGKPPNAPLPPPYKASKSVSFSDQPQRKPTHDSGSSLVGSKRDAGGAPLNRPAATTGAVPRPSTTASINASARPFFTSTSTSSAARSQPLADHFPAQQSRTVTPNTKAPASAGSSLSASSVAQAQAVTPQSSASSSNDATSRSSNAEVATPLMMYSPEPASSQSGGAYPDTLTPAASCTASASATATASANATTTTSTTEGASGREVMSRCAEVDAQVAALAERLQQARLSLQQVKRAMVAQTMAAAVAESKILSNDCLVTVAPLLLDLQGKLVNLRSQWDRSKQPPSVVTSDAASQQQHQAQVHAQHHLQEQEQEQAQAQAQAQAQEQQVAVSVEVPAVEAQVVLQTVETHVDGDGTGQETMAQLSTVALESAPLLICWQ